MDAKVFLHDLAERLDATNIEQAAVAGVASLASGTSHAVSDAWQNARTLTAVQRRTLPPQAPHPPPRGSPPRLRSHSTSRACQN